MAAGADRSEAEPPAGERGRQRRQAPIMRGCDEWPFIRWAAFVHLSAVCTWKFSILNLDLKGGKLPTAIYYPITHHQHHQHGKAAAESRGGAVCLPPQRYGRMVGMVREAPPSRPGPRAGLMPS